MPVVPGRDAAATRRTKRWLPRRRAVGYPALVKASAGGGGMGMRVVRTDGEGAERSRRRGAKRRRRSATATLYVERLIERPRHVEIQVFADDHGNVVHLFERECSLQRRHQKVIEESPSPALTPALRATHGRRRGCRCARRRLPERRHRSSSCWRATGDAAQFYFLEMNTRLQVEHPVTEAVTGVDLVRAQLRVAAGEPLAVDAGVADAARARDRVPRLRGRPRTRSSCHRRDRCCSIASRAGPASESTAA